MATLSKRRAAEQLYEAGRLLLEQGRYREALKPLDRAEETFRKMDVRGRPFSSRLSNGISGLANTLFLKGICFLKLGDYKRGAACFESSLVNSRFEKKKYLRKFCAELRPLFIECYENLLTNTNSTNAILETGLNIDINFRFPFSLDPDFIPAARLYELDPERFRSFKDIYTLAKEKYTILKRMSTSPEEKAIKRLGLAAWAAIVLIYITYYIAFQTLYDK